jgi:ATP-dependent Clp protease ATP-binding subunit ClpA
MIEDTRRVGALLHLGNANELCESGKAWGSGGVGALLAPAISEGKIQVVLECTPEELARLQRTEPRLIGGLTKLEIHEPDPETTRRILLDAAASWKPIDISAMIAARAQRKRLRAERRAGIEPTTIKQNAEPARTNMAPQSLPRVDPEALECLDRLHRRFPTSSASPGRVLTFFSSVMSELVASAQHHPLDRPLDVACVTDAFSRQTGLPAFLVDSQSPPDLTAITAQLSAAVLGQPGVIEVLVDLIAVLAADLSRGDRPLASLLLIGPTGVGKTETAKALSQLVYSDVSRLVRIDMAEYSDPIAAMRLVGTTSEPDGVLTSAVQAQPFSLILLDEFEKADRSVFDLLLQVLGEGRLTDRRGRVADFRNSIIMMTSNLGVEDYRDVPLGLAAGASHGQSLMEDPGSFARLETHFRRKVREFLRPEMANRIDRILAYHPLAVETIELLTRRQIDALRRRDGLREHDGAWQVDDDVIESIARDAYQPQYGARPLARQIQRELLVPLAEMIPKMRTRALDLQISRRNGRAQVSSTPAVDSKGLFARTVIVAGREKSIGLGFVEGEVSAAADTPRSRASRTADLIAKVSRLRRLSQSFVACELMREANTQYTLLCRTIKRALKKQRNRLARERIRHGEQARQRDRLLVKIREGQELKKLAEELEADVFSTVYAHVELDAELVRSRASELEDTLFLMLCDLSESDQANHDRITLIVSGPD